MEAGATRMKTIIGFTLLTIAGLLAALFVYLGAYKTVAMSVGERGPYLLVYKKHVGPYHKVVPIIEEVEKWALMNGEACKVSFGEYFDDPNVVAEDRLTSNGGCVVKKKPEGELPEGFEFRELPAHMYVIGDFDGAPSLGPLKAYPKAKAMIREKGFTEDGPILELYERPDDGSPKFVTHYLFPVKSQATNAN
jgi:hypothetical protein